MRFSRSLSALAIPVLTASAILSPQVVRSNSGEAPHNSGPLANNAPYTLTRTSITVQTLADGATFTRTSIRKTARDSEGRTYDEAHMIGPDGQPDDDWVNCSVFDPIAHTRINWDNRTKIVSVAPVPAPDTTRQRTEPKQVQQVAAAPQSRATRPPRQVTFEDLGVHTLAGIDAKGTRSTVIIPTGELGNDRPFTTVTEQWRSTEYGVDLLKIDDDPRIGRTTDEVTDFKPGEPDPALFQIPEGYTVRQYTVSQSN